MYPTPSYLPGLTPLRGIAALLVLIFHFNLFVMPVLDPALTTLHLRWYLLVDFFFILSGFIMAHVYGGWFAERVEKSAFQRYMGARFARLYPLHLLTLLWVVGLYGVMVANQVPLAGPPARVLNPAAIPFNLLLLQGFFSERFGTWNTPAWSIGVEWVLYLAFPFMARPLARLSGLGQAALLLAVLAGYAFLTWHLTQPFTDPDLPAGFKHQPGTIDTLLLPFNFLRGGLGFGLGMLAYRAYRQGWGQAVLKSGAALLGLGLGLLVLYHVEAYDLLTVWAFPLIILAAVYNTGRAARVLQSRPFQRLGDWSFSMYLVHIPLVFTFLTINLVNNPQPAGPPPVPSYGPMPLVLCAVFVGLVIGLSALTYRFVEIPARRWLNRRLGRGAVVEAPAVA